MSTFYVTFGQKYRHEPHPLGAHPDGWYEVMAKDFNEAVEITQKYFGDKYAFLYPEEEFNKNFYPWGSLGTIP